MNTNNDMEQTSRDSVRVFVTGVCDGLPDLREALGKHPEIELVGWSDNVLEGASGLTGGHLQVVLHATRSATLPANDVAAIREYTRAPVILLASGGSPSLLEDALEADVADVILLPQLTDNVVFAIRKACHSGRKQQASGGGRQGRLVTVFSPKGGTGKTVLSTNISASLAKHWGKRALLLDLDLQFGDAAIMLGIELSGSRDEVVDRLVRLDPEHDRGVAELEVEVEQERPLAPVLRERGAEVGRGHGLARPALRREHGHDAALLAARGSLCTTARVARLADCEDDVLR